MKERTTKRKSLLQLMLMLLVVISMLLTAACSQVKESDTTPSQAEPQVEEIPPVALTMPEYELSYSGELKDVIQVRDTETEVGPGLEFYVNLSGTDTTIFVLHYNSDQGELVSMLENDSGEQIPIAFEMAEMPAGLSDEDANTFSVAQDSVNEIISSLKLK